MNKPVEVFWDCASGHRHKKRRVRDRCVKRFDRRVTKALEAAQAAAQTEQSTQE